MSAVMMHVCTPGCAFERVGNEYTCSVSGRVHTCGVSCVRMTSGLHGRYCELTHTCHGGVTPSERRSRVPSPTHTVNQKDKFFHSARDVIHRVSQTALPEDQVDSLATKCLAIFSRMKENHHAFQKITAISHDYLVLSLLYMLLEGMSANGVQLVPQVEELEDILPSKCDIHKCFHDTQRRACKKLRYSSTQTGSQSPRGPLEHHAGVRKRTLTNTSRSICEALKIWLEQ